MSLIMRILQNKKITDYLTDHGHRPIRVDNKGRISYLCPFPDHKETKPSFMVFTDAEFENFMCFGCSRNYSIIDLVMAYENLTFKETVKQLGMGLGLSIEDNIESQIKMINSQFKKSQPGHKTLSSVLFDVSSLCRLYLNSVNQDESEKRIIDDLYAKIDADILQVNLEGLEETAALLPKILIKRKEKINASRRSDKNTQS